MEGGAASGRRARQQTPAPSPSAARGGTTSRTHPPPEGRATGSRRFQPPVSDAFIRLIRMMITPIIFTTVVIGIAGMGGLKRLGRIGIKSLVYFEVMTTLALIIGWIVAATLRPGAGMTCVAISDS